jgi:GTP cyclohydrolase II
MAFMFSTTSLDQWLDETSARLRQEGHPIVTLSYAQSLDGSIALRRGTPLAISGNESMRMTHQLRAAHDAILVGIGTIESDDPQLTVRLTEGESPAPIILDSQLRIPVHAKLFQNLKKPILVCLEETATSEKAVELKGLGATILPVKTDAEGHLSLPKLLSELSQRGIKSVMVEGGAKVISAFLGQRLLDRVVLTIAPVFVGGLKAFDYPISPIIPEFLQLKNVRVELVGKDIVVLGERSL